MVSNITSVGLPKLGSSVQIIYIIFCYFREMKYTTTTTTTTTISHFYIFILSSFLQATLIQSSILLQNGNIKVEQLRISFISLITQYLGNKQTSKKTQNYLFIDFLKRLPHHVIVVHYFLFFIIIFFITWAFNKISAWV